MNQKEASELVAILDDAKEQKDWEKVREVQADLLDMADNLRHPERWFE